MRAKLARKMKELIVTDCRSREGCTSLGCNLMVWDVKKAEYIRGSVTFRSQDDRKLLEMRAKDSVKS